MKVDSSCAGCWYCDYEILDDYGCYDPGYYCQFDECIHPEYPTELEGEIDLKEND